MAYSSEQFHFISEDEVAIVVDWHIVYQSALLVNIVDAIFDYEGNVDGPMHLPISGQHMKKIFGFCELHRDDYYNDSMNHQLTEDDYDLFATDKYTFTKNDLLDLLAAAVELDFPRLADAITVYLIELAEQEIEENGPVPLELDLDDDIALTPEEEEEFRRHIEWITQV